MVNLKITGWPQWLTSVIPATQEAEIGRMVVLGQPGQKLDPILTNNPGVWYICDPSYWGGIGKKIFVQGLL
jgi:hypothetical protein